MKITMYKNFEDFLMEQHGKQYIGTDDNMPDNFREWVCNLDVDEWFKFGNEFAKAQRKDGM